MARWGPFPWYFMTTSYTQVQESQKNLSRKPLRVFTGLQRGWTHETEMNLYQFNGNIKQWRRRETSSWCETSMHHLCGIGMYGWQWNWITKAAGWILKCTGVFSLLTFTRCSITDQTVHDSNHTAKPTREFLKEKKWDILQWPGQSPDLCPLDHAFQLLKLKVKTERPTNKEWMKVVSIEDLTEPTGCL